LLQAGLLQKLDEIRQKIDWTERLDIVCEPAKAIPGETATDDKGDAAKDDFKRELLLYVLLVCADLAFTI